MYFIGETFYKEKCKIYKKFDAAEKAADKQNVIVFNENGEVIKDFRKIPVEQTHIVSEGQEQHTMKEVVTDTIDGVPAVRIKGKIRRIFNGSIRVRKEPSWENDVVKGATTFYEKTVTHVMEIDGKTMYMTLDGYFISGDSKLVEYIEE